MSGGLLIDTDILAEYLLAPPGSTPLLRRLLAVAPCLTSVLQAAELLACAATSGERKAVEGLLAGLKVMGLNGRYATTMAQLSSSTGGALPVEGVALAALAIESRLSVVTDRMLERLCNISGVRVLCGSALQQESEEELRNTLAVEGATRR